MLFLSQGKATAICRLLKCTPGLGKCSFEGSFHRQFSKDQKTVYRKILMMKIQVEKDELVRGHLCGQIDCTFGPMNWPGSLDKISSGRSMLHLYHPKTGSSSTSPSYKSLFLEGTPWNTPKHMLTVLKSPIYPYFNIWQISKYIK